MDISELLAFSVKNQASDLHLSAGLPPMIRVHGDVRRINLPPMEHKDVHAMVYDIMNDGQRKFYEENLECDFSFSIPNLARFRVNAFVHQRGAGAVMRRLVERGALGIVTTHDLALAQIADELAPAMENVHFEDYVEEGEIRFDFRLRPGVVTKSNAIELMRAVGLEV